MPETPTLYVCRGNEGGPRIHPCRRVQEDLQEAGIAFETDKLPTLKFPGRDGHLTLPGDSPLDQGPGLSCLTAGDRR
jgi:hypothetical protein